MKTITRYIPVLGILLLTAFVAAAACLYFNVPARLQKQPAAASVAKQNYSCPMHPDVVQDHPGNCPKCGMNLIPASSASSEAEPGCGNHDSGCCAKPAVATLTLPPGHPPVDGYSVAPAADCTNHVH